MGTALKIFGIVIISVAFIYKVNIVLSLHNGTTEKNFISIFLDLAGIIFGCLYGIAMSVLLFLFDISGGYIMLADLMLFLALSTYVDVRWHIVPNKMNIALLISQLVCAFAISGDGISVLNLIITILLLGGLTVISLKSSEEIGMGDVKLLAIICGIYGLSYVLYTAIIAMILVLLYAIPGMIRKKINLKTGIPFVPFYSIGTIIYFLIDFI